MALMTSDKVFHPRLISGALTGLGATGIRPLLHKNSALEGFGTGGHFLEIATQYF